MYDFAVIFDMDGVMVDNNKYNKVAWRNFCKKYGFDLSEDDLIHHVFGRINSDTLTYLFGENLSEEDFDKYVEEKESMYREIFVPHIKPVKGLIELLDELRSKNIKRAIATSAYQKNVDFVLSNIGAKDYFDVIVMDSDVTKGKPHPEVYLKAAEKIQIEPEKCVVFEDSLSGIKSAKAAGMKVIALTTTHPEEELSHSDMVIKDFNEINLEKINQLF